ncbi:hypothetical protein [Streptomyces sp. NBC_00645]|uniref:hypothetical protein n=1 Tax=Streptomyces sp. NBC_00645 TaxID=2975795 RepID=UPI0032459264
MTSRATTIATLLRHPQPVREPLAIELRGPVVQLLGSGTTDPTWTATPEVLAEAIDSALQKDTPVGSRPTGTTSTARAEILAVLRAVGYNEPAALELLARAHREPHEAAPDPDCPESLAGGHALIVEHGGYELIGTCQCGRRLGSLLPSGSVDHLAGIWERHTRTELPPLTSPIGAS